MHSINHGRPRTLVSLLLVATLVPLALSGCRSGNAKSKDPAATQKVPVQVQALSATPYQRTTRAVATLEPWRQVQLRAEAAGRVLKLHADVGHTVKRGKRLAHLDGSVAWRTYKTAKVTIRQAEVSLSKAKLDLARARELRRTGDYSQAQLDQAQSVYDTAKAAVDLARAQTAQSGQQLSYYGLRAPFAGVISQRAVEVGDYVSPGSALFTLVEQKRLKAVVGVSPADGLLLKAGGVATITVTTSAGPIRKQARVHLIRPVVDSATRRVEVELEVDNGDGRLRPGVIGRAELPVGPKTPKLLVPPGAIVEQNGQHFVFTVRSGRANRVLVRLGVTTATHVEVRPKSGSTLADGAALVVVGVQRLRPGSAVAVVTSIAATQPVTKR